MIAKAEIVKKYTLKRGSSLKSKKQIELLFSKGYVIKAYPLLVKYHATTDPRAESHKILFSVSKKRFRKAVDRNLLKRRIREAYRLNQFVFSSDSGNPFLNIAFIYVGKEFSDFLKIQNSILKALKALNRQYEEKEK